MTQPVPEVEAEEGARRVAAGALLLDIREAQEWAAGHAEGAVWIPMSELAARQDELPAAQEIVVICRSGNRSAHVTGVLIGAGYNAVNLGGGSLAWVVEGLPFVKDDGTEGFVA